MKRRIPHLQSVYYIISPSIENLCGIYRARSGGRYKCTYQLPTSSSPPTPILELSTPAHYQPRRVSRQTHATPLFSRRKSRFKIDFRATVPAISRIWRFAPSEMPRNDCSSISTSLCIKYNINRYFAQQWR